VVDLHHLRTVSADRGHGAHRSAALTTKSPSEPGPCVNVPPGQADPFGQADQPQAAARQRATAPRQFQGTRPRPRHRRLAPQIKLDNVAVYAAGWPSCSTRSEVITRI
jgi:hypothetical protein